MNNNIRIARELVRIARMLVAKAGALLMEEKDEGILLKISCVFKKNGLTLDEKTLSGLDGVINNKFRASAEWNHSGKTTSLDVSFYHDEFEDDKDEDGEIEKFKKFLDTQWDIHPAGSSF